MPGGGDDLRRKVVWSAARGVRFPNDKLGKTHVRELDVASLREQQVLRLQVTIDDPPLMAMLEGKDCAGNVVLGVLLAAMKALSVIGGVQFSAQCWLQEEIEGLRAIVRLVKLDDEEGVGHQQYVFLVHHAFLHARLDHIALAEALQRIGVASHLVLPELNSTESSATQKAYSFQILFHNPLPLLVRRRGWCHPVHPALDLAGSSAAAFCLFVLLDNVSKRSEKHLECIAVQRQSLRRLRHHNDGRCARRFVQQRSLAEEGGGAHRLTGLQAGLLFVILEDGHLTLIEDIEGVTQLALLQNDLLVGKVHLNEGLRNSALLLCQQWHQDVHSAEIIHILVNFLFGDLHQDFLEVGPVDNPHERLSDGLHCGSAGYKVQQRQLTKAATRGDSTDIGSLTAFKGFLGALGPSILAILMVGRHEDLKAAFLNDIKVVCHQITLLDDFCAGWHILLPRNVDHRVDAFVVKADHSLKVLISSQSLSNEAPVVVGLRRWLFFL
mmetsp:Transcript_29925/g.75372  ORF Transcript_29925/g.75372 Transcript_29925/m.75372 type:complete len:496 (-) Transcript_29925:640-2127(-)